MQRKSVIRSSVVIALLLSGTVAFAQLGLVVTASPAKAVSSALLLTSAATTIKYCDFTERNAMLADVDARLKAAADAVVGFQHEAKQLRGEARADFKSALQEVKAQENPLKQNLRSAKKSSLKEWPSERTLLASSYGDYASAVSRLEAVAVGVPSMK